MPPTGKRKYPDGVFRTPEEAAEEGFDPLEPKQQIPPGEEGEAPVRRKKYPRRARIDKVREQIAGDVNQLTGLISLLLAPISPTASEFNEQRVEKTVEDTARLCMRHPRLLELIKASGDVTAYVGMVELFAGIAIAVGVDRGMIDPEFFAARALGVTYAFKVARGEVELKQEENGSQATEHGDGDFPVPALVAGVATDGA